MSIDAPTLSPRDEVAFLLIACRHAQALLSLARGEFAERAAFTFAREVLGALHPVCTGLREPADLGSAQAELGEAITQLHALSVTRTERASAPALFNSRPTEATAPVTAEHRTDAPSTQPLTGQAAYETGKAVNASSGRGHRAKGGKARHAGRAPHKSRQPIESRLREGERS